MKKLLSPFKSHLGKTREALQKNKLTLTLTLLPFLGMLWVLLSFSGDHIILGAEGNYIIDFRLTRAIGTNTWVPLINGTGFPTAVTNNLSVIYHFLAYLQGIGLSVKTINILSALLAYTLPYFAMLWLLCRVMKKSFFLSWILALLYVVNPVVTYHIQGLMFWNIAPLVSFPILFGLVYLNWKKPFWLFLSFGLVSTILSFSLSNIPYLGIFQIMLLIAIFIIPLLREESWNWKRILGNWCVLQTAFLLFNAWWFINLIRFNAQDVALYYSKEFAVNWASQNTFGDGSIIRKLLSLTTLISREDINAFTEYYFSFPIYQILFIPMLIVLWALLREMKTGTRPRKLLILVFIIWLTAFLNKGTLVPLGEVFSWMLRNIPFFYIFKTPHEKFTPLLLLLVVLAIAEGVKVLGKRKSYALLIIYVMVGIIPYATHRFMPDYVFEKNDDKVKLLSKKIDIKSGDYKARQRLNTDRLEYRYMLLPGTANYQETIYNRDENIYYRGINPFLHGTNKPFITSYGTISMPFNKAVFDNLANPELERLLNVLSVRKIVFDADIYGSAGFMHKETPEELQNMLNAKYQKEEYPPISIYSRKPFLPRIYTTKDIIESVDTPENILNVLITENASTRSVVFFADQGSLKQTDTLKDILTEWESLLHPEPEEETAIRGTPESTMQEDALDEQKLPEKPGQKPLSNTNLPVLEMKKISPVKYRIVIHAARGPFPLVFSETYHPEWKIYLSKRISREWPFPEPEKYTMFQNQEEDQANPAELKIFLKNGFISSMGRGKEKLLLHKAAKDNAITVASEEAYNIDFISKNFNGTIQNDNLLSGWFFETWGNPKLAEDKHIKANGFANAWWMNPREICEKHMVCEKSADGSYTFEVILEFAPERLYYLGFLITSLSLLGSLIVLQWSTRNTRKSHGL